MNLPGHPQIRKHWQFNSTLMSDNDIIQFMEEHFKKYSLIQMLLSTHPIERQLLKTRSLFYTHGDKSEKAIS